ncbi:MAG: aconitase family protein [Myxococcota bacterium]
MGVVLHGALDGWAAPKDVVLALAARLGTSGATHCVLEYLGDGVAALGATGRATIANMGAELAPPPPSSPPTPPPRASSPPPGAALLPALEAHQPLLVADPEVAADPDAAFDRVVHLDLAALEGPPGRPAQPRTRPPAVGPGRRARRSRPGPRRPHHRRARRQLHELVVPGRGARRRRRPPGRRPRPARRDRAPS